MCGIFGFVTSKPSKENAEMFRSLLLNSKSRGRDATGILYVTDKTKEIIMYKAPMEAVAFDKEHMDKHMDGLAKAKIAIGHIRAATMGSEKNNVNNHPVESEHYFAIHNGMLHSLPRLDKYKYKGEVDTEIFLSYVEEKGLNEAMPYLGYGSGAVVLLDKRDPTKLLMTRSTSPTFIALKDDQGTMLFASEDEFLFKAMPRRLDMFPSGSVIRLPDEKVFEVAYNPISIKELFTYKPKSRSYSSYGYGYCSGVYVGGTHYEEAEKWKTDFDKKKGAAKKDTTPAGQGYYFSPLHMGWIDEETFPRTVPTNRFYFEAGSRDFMNWDRLLNARGFVSSDKQLFKKWDDIKRKHFLMPLDDAIAEGHIFSIQDYSIVHRRVEALRIYSDTRDLIIAITTIPKTEEENSRHMVQFGQYDFVELDDLEVEVTAKKGVVESILRFDITDIEEIEQRVLECIYDRDLTGEDKVVEDKKKEVEKAKEDIKNLPTIIRDAIDRSAVCSYYKPIGGITKVKKLSCLYCMDQKACIERSVEEHISME